MATNNKKFRLQNGVDIIGEMTFNDVQVIDENGNVVAASIQTGVESIVDQSYVNALQVTAQSAVTAQSVTDISSFSTTDVSEGSNLYYTDARVRGAVQGGTGVSYDQSTGEFSVDLSGGDGVSISGNTISVDGSALSQNLVPSVTDTYSLGTADKVWKDVFIGPGSLYLNGTKILEDNSGTITMYADPGQNLSFGVTAGGSIDFNAGDESIQMKSDVVMSVDQTISTVGGAATKFGGEIDMQGDKVVNVGTPTADADAATKAYVDSRVNAGSVDGDKTFSDNVVVQGNLTVQGTTTTVNSETISLADNIIDVNSNVTSGLPTENAGLRVMRGDEAAAQIRWNEASDHWETYNGSSWTKVALETDDLAEGSSNLYFTDARAQSAVAGDISSAVAAEASLRSDADTAEASARAAADSDLQDSINAEVSRAQGVEAGLDSDISVNAAAIAVNAGNIAQEISDRESAISVEAAARSAADDALDSDLGVETAARISGDSTLQDNIDAEALARSNADSGLQSQITALDSKHDSDHSELEQALSSEVASRQANDSDLQSQITTVSSAVDAIVGTSPESLNTLQEIVAAFEGADTNLQATITANTVTIGDHTSDIGTLQGQVSALQNDVAGHDNDITTLQPVVTGHDSDITALEVFTGLGTELGTAAASLAAAINEIHTELDSVVSDLASESSRAAGSESSLDSDITALEAALAAEVSARATADSREVSDRQAAVSAEATARADADAALDSDLGVETAARIAGDAALDSDLTVEIAARIAGDQGLQSQIDSLSSSLTDEGNGRDSDVSSLQAQINSILSNTDQAAIDSLTEVVSAFENADNSLGTLITNNTNTIASLQTQINGNDGDIVGLDTRVGVLESEMDVVQQDIIDLPGEIKACIVGGLCIETEVLANGNVEVRVDEVDVVDNSTETSGLTVRNANELGGQEPSHYRIDIYDINGTIVN
jgi:hypothetical protein